MPEKISVVDHRKTERNMKCEGSPQLMLISANASSCQDPIQFIKGSLATATSSGRPRLVLLTSRLFPCPLNK